jgi:hypothetical protein
MSKVTCEQYEQATLFCDAAYSQVGIHNQVSFIAEEKVTCKLKFEWEAMGTGVQVKDYSSDNGVYTSKEFMKEVHTKGQGIKHSGVGGHHHKGVTKTIIKNDVWLAHTMIIQSALR